MATRLRTAALTSMAAALLLTAGATGAASANGATPGVKACNGYVGLTYDDGPTSTTSALVNALNSAGVKATFFVWGQRAQQNPSALQQVVSAGHWVANHSWTHPHMTSLSTTQMASEISQTQNGIQQTTGQRPTLFRPPYGETNATLRSVEQQQGIQAEVLWSHDSRDWAGASTQQIVQTASSMNAGNIILMHDGYQTTIQAIPQIVSNLAARNLCPGKIVPGTNMQPRVVAP